jgi:hypothetical protein
MVTSHKMMETEMDYRGSKSIVSLSKIKNTFVKEQRVDGSYLGIILFPKLRCNLMGCESNYQINVPSKQIFIQRKNYCIYSPVGFIDPNNNLNS